jgi:hypothetical protein
MKALPAPLSSSRCATSRRSSALATFATVALLVSLAGSFVGTGQADAAARPRRGGACALRLTGIVFTGTPQLMCVPIQSCTGRTLRRVWVVLGATEGYPSLAERVRYGNCRREPTVTTTTPTTIRPVVEGDGSGVRCLVGRWEFGGANLRSYLSQATGGAAGGPDFTGSIVYQFTGAPAGDSVSGDIIGSGRFTGRSPDGVVEGVIAAVTSARYDATNNTMSLRGASALFTYRLTINGVEQPIETLSFDGGTPLIAYSCSGSTLRLPIAIPAAAGQPARNAEMVMTRVG